MTSWDAAYKREAFSPKMSEPLSSQGTEGQARSRRISDRKAVRKLKTQRRAQITLRRLDRRKTSAFCAEIDSERNFSDSFRSASIKRQTKTIKRVNPKDR